MSAVDDLGTMAQLFAEITHLNLEAAAGLAQGRPPMDLATLFQAKEAATAKLLALLPLLETVTQGTDLQAEVFAAQAAQGEAARSEARLSELLGKLVSQRGKAGRAYQQNGPQTPAKGWEVKG